MQHCPRCNSSMIAIPGDVYDAYAQLWHCLACGYESFRNPVLQAEDEALREQLESTTSQLVEVPV